MLPKALAILICFAFSAAIRADAPPRGRPALWFDVGEELHYRIHWGVIHVGDTRVTTEWIEEDGRELLLIRYRTRSNAFLDRIYKVDDTIEAVIEPHSFLPVRFSKVLNEGRYKTDELTIFDHAARKAYWTHRGRGDRKEFEIDADTRDIVTFMYFMRKYNFRPGETAEFRVMADEKIYDLSVTAGPIEFMKMPRYGRVQTLRITPEASFQGLFVRKGRMTLWISQDARRIATRIQATVPVADVHINLHEVKGPGDDMWVRGAAAASSAADERWAAGEGPHVH
jgi:hypothetical protein